MILLLYCTIQISKQIAAIKDRSTGIAANVPPGLVRGWFSFIPYRKRVSNPSGMHEHRM